jgi:hypothetical protein
MKALRFGAATVALGSASALFVMQVIGCGGDDTASQSAPDASDASMMTDSTTTPDAPSPSSEASAEGDADAAAPTKGDADAASTGGGDGGGGDGAVACPITVPTADQFFHTYAATLCQSLKGCCNTGPKFDMQGCLGIYAVPGSGGFLGVGQPSKYLDGGRVAYDPGSACQCLEAVSAINCGTVLADTLGTVQQTCLAAVHGNVAIAITADGGDAGDAGQQPGCASSYECVKGAFCTREYLTVPAADASLGNCEPLVADGGACANSNQCSYLGNGVGSLHCSAGGVCSTRSAAGVTCGVGTDCASNLCTASSCSSGEVVASPALCTYFTLPDAGDGG